MITKNTYGTKMGEKTDSGESPFIAPETPDSAPIAVCSEEEAAQGGCHGPSMGPSSSDALRPPNFLKSLWETNSQKGHQVGRAE